jgi:hypothetical protein
MDPANHGECPSCGSAELERLLSSFSTHSETSRKLNLQQGRKVANGRLRDKRHADAEESARHHH